MAVINCVNAYGNICLTCLTGSVAPSQRKTCADLAEEYSYEARCQPCSGSVHTINSVVFATAVVGGASAMLCLAVIVTIVAHSRDRVSMRDRIVVGLMMANAVYSTANAIPLNALHTDVVNCGRVAVSFDVIRFGRAWWFCGKYGLVCFELFILGASIRALNLGLSVVPAGAEAVMHATCCTVAVLAFVVFYILCEHINAGGYNLETEKEVYTNAYYHGNFNDDHDDEEPSVAASSSYQTARASYDNLVREMLVAWDVLVGLAIVLWVVLRVLHRHYMLALRAASDAAAQAEAADVWADTRRGTWAARRRVLVARKEAFTDVAKPLEPYIVVFVAFVAPAVVMSTSFCQTHSGAHTATLTASNINAGSNNLTYGTCDVWCEFVLAFRSLGAVAVYLLPREHRAELVAIRVTWRKLFARTVGCLHRAPHPHARLGRDYVDDDGFELVPLSCDHQEARSYAYHKGDNSVHAAAADPIRVAAKDASWSISECDVVKVQKLGEGSFGEVWEGRLRSGGQKVAIKILFAGAVDGDGDAIDPSAAEDFRKECSALKRVDSPHLLKFVGFGTTECGPGFIVTELMSGGSLEDVLHDPKQDLPWHLRVAIGLQVALGMEHLHAKYMMHRDLKSPNVLLDQNLKAKVCDFGLSRLARPTRDYVVHSPFTGVTQLLPHADTADIHGGPPALSVSQIAVSILGACGTMTKAAGSLLWMAPEVFRGDQSYTKAVDVYSFGVLLWELATRKTPWEDEFASDQMTFFNGLNRALQTGRRPGIPDSVLADHGVFVSVIQRCWGGDPADRPTFSETVKDLAECLRGTDRRQPRHVISALAS